MRQRLEEYRIPRVTLTASDGSPVSLPSLLDGDRPVILNFIFTSCTTVCPVMTAAFTSVSRQLGASRSEVELVSISIDPDHDTPARLVEYAHQRGAADLRLLTGEREAILKVQKAFRVYRGDKMNHAPVTFVRAAPGARWLRMEGLVTASDLLAAYHELRSS
jgi:protein SCO1/2